MTRGLTESAQYAVKSMQYAAKLRDEAKEEKARLAQEKRLSFNQKVGSYIDRYVKEFRE